MTECKHFTVLPEDHVNYLIPSNIEGVLSGAIRAKQDQGGIITLTYSDNTEESRKTSKDLVSDFASFFDVVSFVQSTR